MAITLDGTNGIVAPSVENADGAFRPLISGTAVATTSGTAFDFTGIPSWAKRITVMFDGISLSAAANILVQIGSGSFTTTGYYSASSQVSSGGVAAYSSTAGFIIGAAGATTIISGIMVISHINNNRYVESHSGAYSSPASQFGGGNSPTLSGALDRIRITSTSTDTFDAGSINIMYE